MDTINIPTPNTPQEVKELFGELTPHRTKEGYLKCPYCMSRVYEVGQHNGPDDWDITGAVCGGCKEEWGY